MTAYYNEIDPFAADWLRELIKARLIAPGIVDTRSIEDVVPTDLNGFTQHHFFAGIGVWSYALRLAGWPDHRPVWTGSCPCPPFSVAAQKKSCPQCGGRKPLPHAFRTGVFRCTACGHDWYADGRHLWPEFLRLIGECRPVTVFGEQVAGRDGLAWGDIVQATLELEGYTVGRVPFASCGVGAPHIRQRLFWVANAPSIRCVQQRPAMSSAIQGECSQRSGQYENTEHARQLQGRFEGLRRAGWLGNTSSARFQERERNGQIQHQTVGTRSRETIVSTGDSYRVVNAAYIHSGGRSEAGGLGSPESSLNCETWERNGETHRAASTACRLADSTSTQKYQEQQIPQGYEGKRKADQSCGCGLAGSRPGPTDGFWRDADWLFCRDEFWRPVEPGTFPLAYGATNRVGRLRGYGNAINAEAAKEFIRAFMQFQEHSHV